MKTASIFIQSYLSVLYKAYKQKYYSFSQIEESCPEVWDPNYPKAVAI